MTRKRAIARIELSEFDSSMLQALQLHQVELEMQNQMLLKAQAELEETRDRYADLFDFAPVAYITLSHSSHITESNHAATELFSPVQRQLIGLNFEEFVDPDDVERWSRHFVAGWKIPGINLPVIELSLIRHKTEIFSAELHCMAMFQKDSHSSMRIALFDTTERRAAVDELQHYAYFDLLKNTITRSRYRGQNWR